MRCHYVLAHGGGVVQRTIPAVKGVQKGRDTDCAHLQIRGLGHLRPMPPLAQPCPKLTFIVDARFNNSDQVGCFVVAASWAARAHDDNGVVSPTGIPDLICVMWAGLVRVLPSV